MGANCGEAFMSKAHGVPVLAYKGPEVESEQVLDELSCGPLTTLIFNKINPGRFPGHDKPSGIHYRAGL